MTAVKEQMMDVLIPDIGATEVDVIEILVQIGDEISKGQSLVTLEGDKATMDIPSPADGVVETIALKLGDKVSQGSLLLVLKSKGTTEETSVSKQPTTPVIVVPDVVPDVASTPERPKDTSLSVVSDISSQDLTRVLSAGPAARRLARELGISLEAVLGSGRGSRITKEDVVQYVKNKINHPSTSGHAFLPTIPSVDFGQFGDIEVKPLNKIKRLTGAHVHRSWITIPHVTQFDEADITELEAFRKTEAHRAEALGYKLTLLAFVCKVVSKALQMYPQFNTSLDASGENLIYKQYVNIGVAVETPQGLVVPVMKEVDRLSVDAIAKEMARLSTKARDKGLAPTDMNGGTFTISSLGGIGGTAFTPIVNAPEVAILGLSRASIKPIYQEGAFQPRLVLPLSLSYDHRVIDGAEAARFTRFVAEGLNDIRRILL
jgi:pyruvate dehydrogenase E2 component (dihydrolipoamide acetyltransferase)